MAQSNNKYDHQKTEAKWQKFWQTNKAFVAVDGSKKRKTYVLDMFPYPSGEGLHVGHPRGYVGSDIIAHYYRLKGCNVLHPIGFDAFGLPAENAAIKAGVHPADNTKQNIERFSQQLKMLGLSYDWGRVIDTSSPDYYKWTQWLFGLLYRHKLAYQKEAYVNWCPKDQTVLANEQIVQGNCERCGTQVMQKKLKQWFFKITEFAEELLTGLDELDWPESTKELQRNWIGRSEGAEIAFAISGSAPRQARDKTGKQVSGLEIKVFTTRADTLFGATYLVLAPEYPALAKIITADRKKEVTDYVQQAACKTELERLTDTKTKTGVFTGAYGLNPATGEKIPIWIADYVLASYGYGAIMAVPAHDQRDFEFAKVYKLPVVEVISSPGGKLPYTGHGRLVNSGKFGNLPSAKAAETITQEVGGKLTVQYRLRDWLVSRQRYWGAPIPIVYKPVSRLASRPIRQTQGKQARDKTGQQMEPLLVDEKDLPVLLPQDVDFKPTGESPLINSKSFQRGVEKKYGKGAWREVDTLDTFVCSSWYFLRYCDPHNAKEFADKELLKYWMPVDLYVGGVEHATGHILYARFITKVLHRLGLVDFDEPFPRLRHQGLILGEGGEKMSKSKGNIVNPDDVVEGYGADALRMYEMFIGPFDQYIPWSPAGLRGVHKFLNKVWNLSPQSRATETDRVIHKLIKKVTADIGGMRFNTAISAFMEFVNLATRSGITKKTFKALVILMAPFAPHLAEEINHRLGSQRSIFRSSWPEFDPRLAVDEVVTIAVQVNGKLRGRLKVAADTPEVKIKKMAEEIETVAKHLGNQSKIKHRYVPGRVINFVTK